MRIDKLGSLREAPAQPRLAEKDRGGARSEAVTCPA
jgi:hypothetical protein